MRLRILGILLTAAVVPALSACQSTQNQSAELAKKGSTVLSQQQGLTVSKQSTDVKVKGTAAFSDVNGAAVVVTLQNTSSQDLEAVPIAIDVLDKKGKSVYKNNVPGIDPSLVSVPFIKAGDTVDWVDDQVLALGADVASVKPKVGAIKAAPLPDLPQIDVTQPKLEGDPVSGTEAVGKVTNRSGAEQHDLLLYAVARKGNKIVAAGRGIIGRLKDSTKPIDYHIFFIGDPTGAQVTVTAFPSIGEEK